MSRWGRRFGIGLSLFAMLVMAGVLLTRTKGVKTWLQQKQAQIKFNWIYTKGEQNFSHAPTAFLIESVKSIQPGNALDVGMGQGRNAIYLAKNGWSVTGFDVADEGLKIAEKEAARLGLKVRCIRASDENFDYGDSTWDLIVLAYSGMAFHDAGLMQRVKKSVRPGGLVVVETFLEWSPESGKPRIDGLPGPGELRQIFADFEIIADREEEGTSEWFTRRTRLIRFACKKRQ